MLSRLYLGHALGSSCHGLQIFTKRKIEGSSAHAVVSIASVTASTEFKSKVYKPAGACNLYKKED